MLDVGTSKTKLDSHVTHFSYQTAQTTLYTSFKNDKDNKLGFAMLRTKISLAPTEMDKDFV